MPSGAAARLCMAVSSRAATSASSMPVSGEKGRRRTRQWRRGQIGGRREREAAVCVAFREGLTCAGGEGAPRLFLQKGGRGEEGGRRERERESAMAAKLDALPDEIGDAILQRALQGAIASERASGCARLRAVCRAWRSASDAALRERYDAQVRELVSNMRIHPDIRLPLRYVLTYAFAPRGPYYSRCAPRYVCGTCTGPVDEIAKCGSCDAERHHQCSEVPPEDVPFATLRKPHGGAKGPAPTSEAPSNRPPPPASPKLPFPCRRALLGPACVLAAAAVASLFLYRRHTHATRGLARARVRDAARQACAYMHAVAIHIAKSARHSNVPYMLTPHTHARNS